jgi:hypothetical protein
VLVIISVCSKGEVDLTRKTPLENLSLSLSITSNGISRTVSTSEWMNNKATVRLLYLATRSTAEARF